MQEPEDTYPQGIQGHCAKALLEELGIYKEVCKKEKKLLGIKES